MHVHLARDMARKKHIPAQHAKGCMVKNIATSLNNRFSHCVLTYRHKYVNVIFLPKASMLRQQKSISKDNNNAKQNRT
jgi:hypothetical protein